MNHHSILYCKEKQTGLTFIPAAVRGMAGSVLFVILTIFFLLISVHPLHGQDKTSYTLSQQEFLDIVLKYHPLARQADIRVQKAKADILIGKSGFDPVLTAVQSQKTFDGTAYYDHVQPELKIPAWYGIELVAGAEFLEGQRINNEETPGKTSYAGVTLSLGKNLVIDKRRATLQTARIFHTLSETEKRSVLNDLLLDASRTYLEWAYYFGQYKIISLAVSVNEKRMKLVRTAVKQGERPALDTTEALTQLQNFQVMQNEALLQWQNAGLDLFLFLWKENNHPYEFTTAVIPDTTLITTTATITETIPPLEELLTSARTGHPDLLQYPLKLSVLTIEKKLKFQELLPKLDLKYYQLGKGYNLLNAKSGALFSNNYRLGIGFSMPLRLSQGRGEYRKAKLKIEETRLNQQFKLAEVENKIRSYYNNVKALEGQSDLLRNTYNNYVILQKGEEMKFFNGESSLFMLNSREAKTIEAQLKLIKINTAYFKSRATLFWAAGLSNQAKP